MLLGHLGTQDHKNIECSDEDYLLALLMVAVAMAFFFVAGRALLFIFPVDDSLVHLLETHTLSELRGNQEKPHHLTLLLVDGPAALFAGSVKHRPTAGHCELVAVLLVSNALGGQLQLGQNVVLNAC